MAYIGNGRHNAAIACKQAPSSFQPMQRRCGVLKHIQKRDAVKFFSNRRAEKIALPNFVNLSARHFTRLRRIFCQMCFAAMRLLQRF